MKKKKILIITTRLPYPMISGAKIRAFHILKALAEKHTVTLISFYGSKNEKQHFGIYESLGVTLIPIFNPAIDETVGVKAMLYSLLSGLPLTVSKYRDSRMSHAIARHIQEMDVVHCEHMHMYQFLFTYNGLQKVLDAHNVETQIAERYGTCESNVFKKLILYLNALAMRRYENKTCADTDMILSVSSQDKHVLETEFGGKCVRLLENGVDVNYFRPEVPTHMQDIPKLVFVGAMDWLPNSDGIKHFVSEVLPLIRKEYPRIQLDVVGKDPPADIIGLSNIPGIRVTGTVDDVRPFVRNAQVFIVPLRFGGGSRLKILEAFASGKPVVSTTLGCEGIECHHEKELLVADTPEFFAAAVIRLLGDTTLSQRLTQNARQLAVESYSWDVICNKLITYYDESTRYTP